jgi:hypothetical protein
VAHARKDSKDLKMLLNHFPQETSNTKIQDGLQPRSVLPKFKPFKVKSHIYLKILQQSPAGDF